MERVGDRWYGNAGRKSRVSSNNFAVAADYAAGRQTGPYYLASGVGAVVRLPGVGLSH